MTGHAHTRPRLADRLTRRLRRPARDAGPFTEYDPAVYAGDPGVPEPAVYADAPRPPWDYTVPDVPGPGSLDSLYDQAADEPSGWYGMTVLDCPPAMARPYPQPQPAAAPPPPVPVPVPVPEPKPGPVAVMMPAPAPVSYPPLSFTADFRDLPVFREVARLIGHAPAGLVRDGGQLPPLPGFGIPPDVLAGAA